MSKSNGNGKHNRNAQRIMEENLALMTRKSEDYSRDNIALTGQSGVAARAMDKVARLVNLTNSGQIPNFETLEDTFRDLFNYAVIGQMMARGEWERSTSMVYLAGAIDAVELEEAAMWRIKATAMFNKKGLSCYNPASAFGLAKQKPSEVISRINRFALLSCHVMLAHLPDGQRCFGTIREVEYARANGKRVVVVASKALLQHVEAYDLEIVHTIEDAVVRISGDAS